MTLADVTIRVARGRIKPHPTAPQSYVQVDGVTRYVRCRHTSGKDADIALFYSRPSTQPGVARSIVSVVPGTWVGDAVDVAAKDVKFIGAVVIPPNGQPITEAHIIEPPVTYNSGGVVGREFVETIAEWQVVMDRSRWGARTSRGRWPRRWKPTSRFLGGAA